MPAYEEPPVLPGGSFSPIDRLAGKTYTEIRNFQKKPLLVTQRYAVSYPHKEVNAMSQYTTGEMAKLCGVSVRTVQYYDTRGILVPTALSEGGRRLYSEQDLSKLRIICFLRELELPIDSIKKLLAEEYPEKVIALLLEEQEKLLRDEISQKQVRVEKIAQSRKALGRMSQVNLHSIGDIAQIMQRKQQLKRLHTTLLGLGFLMDAIEAATLMLGIFRGIWWPFGVGMLAVIGLGMLASSLYYCRTVFICPQCHSIFRPALRNSFFAWHTPYTRKLICPHCGHHGFCVETYGKEPESC